MGETSVQRRGRGTFALIIFKTKESVHIPTVVFHGKLSALCQLKHEASAEHRKSRIKSFSPLSGV